jgi:Holliday junction resolvase-like predicted endonuclease
MPRTETPRTKLLGDAGEHYALSQFSFAGKFAAKMPDNWQDYDLAVETGKGLVRVSVKTRSEGQGWKTSSWFSFDDRKECDWIALIFKPKQGPIRSWVLPFDVAKKNANVPGPNRKDPWMREISWSKLNKLPLQNYEGNWTLARHEPVPVGVLRKSRGD